MKGRLKFFVLPVLLVFAMSGCSIFNQIWLNWTITSVVDMGSYARVYYTVENVGEYDLTGINLNIGIDEDGNGTIDRSGRGSTFSLKENVSENRIDDIYIASDGTTLGIRAEVLGFDIDNP